MSTVKAVVAGPFLAMVYLATLPLALWYWFRERAADRRAHRRLIV